MFLPALLTLSALWLAHFLSSNRCAPDQVTMLKKMKLLWDFQKKDGKSMQCCHSDFGLSHIQPKKLSWPLWCLSFEMQCLRNMFCFCRKWFLLPNPGVCLPLVGPGKQTKLSSNWNFQFGHLFKLVGVKEFQSDPVRALWKLYKEHQSGGMLWMRTFNLNTRPFQFGVIFDFFGPCWSY